MPDSPKPGTSRERAESCAVGCLERTQIYDGPCVNCVERAIADAVREERERCAKVAEGYAKCCKLCMCLTNDCNKYWELAAAIRGGEG